MEDVIFQGSTGAAAGQRHRGLAVSRQQRRRSPDRVPGGGRHPSALALRPERLPAQRLAGPAPRHPGSAPRHRPRQRRRRRHRSEDDRSACSPTGRTSGARCSRKPRASDSTATGSTAPSAGSRRRPSISSGSRTSSPRCSRRSAVWPASEGKAERHVKLTEEKFAVQLTLARRLLDRMSGGSRGHGSPLRGAVRAVARGPPAPERQRAPPRGGLPGRASPRRATAPRSPAGSRRCGSSWASSTATWPWRPSGSPTRNARRLARSRGAQPDESPRAARRWSSRSPPRAIGTPPRWSTSGSGPSWPGAPRRRRMCAVGSAEQRERSGSGSRSSTSRPRRSGRSRASARRWRASSARSASGPPRPPRIGPALQQELAGAERRRDQAVERAGFLSREAKRAAGDAERARILVAETREREAHATGPSAAGPRSCWRR